MQFLPFDYGIRNLGRSKVRLSATLAACTLVVALVIAAAGFVQGMARTLVVPEDNTNVMLIASGSEESVERSQVAGNTASVVAADLPGIRATFGVPHVSSEVHAALIVRPEQDSPRELRTIMRGFTPEAFLVHKRVQIVEGRMPRAGKDEIMVGGLAADMMGVSADRLNIGQTIWFDNRHWTVVGRFRAEGSIMDAEIWVPLTDMQLAMKRDTVSCVVLTLDNSEFADVDAFTKVRFDLGLTAIRESDYFSSILKFYRPVQFMIWSTAMLVGLTGLFGGLNTMYAAFAARKREFGMLQSLGYARRAILLSLVQESVLVAAAGTLLASVLNIVLIEGHSVRFSMGVFKMAIDHRVLLIGMIAGLSIGVLGAVPPAWRCLRMPITSALKSA